MNSVRNALTRKIGPAPAWIWAVVVGVAIYFYRRRTGATQTATDSGANQTLGYYGPYGNNAYPITGSGGGGNGSGSGDTSGSGGSNGSSNGSSGGGGGTAPPNVIVNPPANNPASPTTPAPPKPPSGKRRPKVGSKAGPHGAIVAPYGSKKPPPKEGYTAIGTGGGGWIYKPDKPGGKKTGTRSSASTANTRSGKATTKGNTSANAGKSRNRSSGGVSAAPPKTTKGRKVTKR